MNAEPSKPVGIANNAMPSKPLMVAKIFPISEIGAALAMAP